ncbi:MAG: hypothetical protein K5650_06895 [Bacteroidales bacterium]|nr:hypothetical protein [Bacteroidales bacterium]
MKQLTIILIAIALLGGACQRKHNKVVDTRADGSLQAEKIYNSKTGQPEGEWRYYYPSGKLFATATFGTEYPTGTNWQFYKEDGKPYFSATYDSLTVTELGEGETPATVCLHKADTIGWHQFYSTCTPRSNGITVGGVRQGRWLFYYPNGQVQTEATFVNGLEEGRYNVYRDNGSPYYLGQYSGGQRTGTWEVYDRDGNLVTTKQY